MILSGRRDEDGLPAFTHWRSQSFQMRKVYNFYREFTA